jgi:peptidyl-prolyl cis-trans isomerase B (cyclophilin B)
MDGNRRVHRIALPYVGRRRRLPGAQVSRMYNGEHVQPSSGGLFMPRRLSLFVALTVLVAAVTAGAQPTAKAKGAVITLEKGGEVAIEFFPADAPKTVENFVTLAGKGFYDGTTFHRVVPGFVAQGGDPLSKTLPAGDRRIGTGDPGYKIKAEFNKQKHDRGVVAMARSQDPDSAGSQFYITLAATPHLDGQYTVFGRVTSGMNVVDGIRANDRIKSVKVVGP